MTGMVSGNAVCENARGKIEITAEEFREYRELLAGRDREVISIRTQMRLQNEQALQLARAVAAGLIGETPLGVAIVNARAAACAVELANELLATE